MQIHYANSSGVVDYGEQKGSHDSDKNDSFWQWYSGWKTHFFKKAPGLIELVKNSI